jgi:hypothetical protein
MPSQKYLRPTVCSDDCGVNSCSPKAAGPDQRPGLMLRPPIGTLDPVRFRGLTMLQQRLRLIAPSAQVCVADLVTLEA